MVNLVLWRSTSQARERHFFIALLSPVKKFIVSRRLKVLFKTHFTKNKICHKAAYSEDLKGKRFRTKEIYFFLFSLISYPISLKRSILIVQV